MLLIVVKSNKKRLELVFPYEERELAAFELAQRTSCPEKGLEADGGHVGYFRDVFLGVHPYILHGFQRDDKGKVYFSFYEEGKPSNQMTLVVDGVGWTELVFE